LVVGWGSLVFLIDKITKSQIQNSGKYQNAKVPKCQNPKSKIPNPKQYQNSNFQNSKQELCFGH
jgi:hypothetical protein